MEIENLWRSSRNGLVSSFTFVVVVVQVQYENIAYVRGELEIKKNQYGYANKTKTVEDINYIL